MRYWKARKYIYDLTCRDIYPIEREENMYCIKCGKKLPDDARFCSECGAPVPVTGHEVTSDSIPVTAAVSTAAARADTISASLPNMENRKIPDSFLPEPSESEDLIAPAKMECLSGDSGSVYIQIPNRRKQRKADADKRPQPVIQPAEQRRGGHRHV